MTKFGPRREKPVFGVSDKARFKPVSSATETSKKIDISSVALKLRYDYFLKANNSGADQSARMRRLICTCFVRKSPKTVFFASRRINSNTRVGCLTTREGLFCSIHAHSSSNTNRQFFRYRRVPVSIRSRYGEPI